MKKRGIGLAQAMNGWRYILKETNAKIHLAATILVTSAGFVLGISKGEWLWIITAIALVWIAEAFNTAIEYLVDIVHPEWGKKAGIVKDISAGSVLFAALFALCVAAMIFIPNI